MYFHTDYILINTHVDVVPKYYPARQRFTISATEGSTAPPTPLVDSKTIADYNLKDGAVVIFKDLGMILIF